MSKSSDNGSNVTEAEINSLADTLERTVEDYRSLLDGVGGVFETFTSLYALNGVVPIYSNFTRETVFTFEADNPVRSCHNRLFKHFRQLKNGLWHNYALISQSSHSISVIDLVTGEIAASTKVASGIPQEFHVENLDHFAEGIDFLQVEVLDGILKKISNDSGVLGNLRTNTSPEDFRTWMTQKISELKSDLADAEPRTGQVGFFSILADDYIPTGPELTLGKLDLSRVSEGVLTIVPLDQRILLDIQKPLNEVVQLSHRSKNGYRVTQISQIHL